MFKNYYVILGVARDASAETIRSAYRNLVKRHHPDHGGPGGAAGFQEITDAYRVLSDPERRARFDRQLASARRPPLGAGGLRVGEPEPLVSGPLTLGRRPEIVRPSLEALLERIARNFGFGRAPKFEHAEPIHYELILSPEEAERGVFVPFEVPVFRACPWCGGGGTDWGGPCDACDSRGMRAHHEVVRIRVPAGVRPGTVIEASLAGLGVVNLYLLVEVRVAAH